MATGFEHHLVPKAEVIVRSDWEWNVGAPGGGQFLNTTGTILEVGEVGLVLSVEGGKRIVAFPYARATQIEIVKSP